MKRITPLDRIALLVTSLIAAYQVVGGVDGLPVLATWAYTAAFGVLIISSLLMIINGFDVLDSPLVVIIATIIPLGLSLGMVIENLPDWHLAYLAFVLVGFSSILLSRYILPERAAAITLSLVHGIAGLIIIGLPIALVLQTEKPMLYLFVSLGGALIGTGGMLFALLKTGKLILSADKIFTVLPWILTLMSAAFVLGLGA
ncbi:MAG: hypothetical protein KAI06_11005 [Anaerolineales bacterium]|nr:hypothetical protein [Anaerolineales bacterium]